jgi:hypothetical protein
MFPDMSWRRWNRDVSDVYLAVDLLKNFQKPHLGEIFVIVFS